jgi:beta-aspartyl-peptidase (threonine type)
MNERTNDGGGAAGGLLAVVLIILLLAAGGAFFLFKARGVATARQVAAEAERATAQARMAEASADAEARAAAAAEAAAQDVTADEADAVRTAVGAVLVEQVDAWNRGDIDSFAEHYWKSDDVTFSSGGQTTRGWQATVDGYRERYPTPETMGQVTLSNLEITPLGNSAAMVLGEWKLERESDPIGGNFTLLFRRIDDRWVIVHDHTSRRAE